MTDNLESESGMPTPEETPKAKTRKAKTATVKTTKAKTAARPKKPKAKSADPIGDLGDGEAESATGALAEPAALSGADSAGSTDSGVAEERAQSDAVDGGGGDDAAQAESELPTAAAEAEIPEAEIEDETEAALEATAPSGSEPEDAELRPPRKLERLQKILAQAGIASRRSAEAMITQGRVQVNGKVVTILGSKADAGRDHIRVDGKLLHGAERLRYFMLNKPKGFVTTVKDPEGRPTVMQFFEKMPERLYPVGRLDYQSEGLLLVTNDGELANQLTKAASGVEKTYLVKVSGQPTEDELDLLRGGISIEHGKAGEGRVRTAPARIRQVRQGDNPWYEVVLIEGRNRELRKMFEEIGHFVEKIRRVGYGPLVLDQEPGKLRELEPGELAALRLAAAGKLRTPKAKELRRRNTMDAQLPTLAPRPSRLNPARRQPERPAGLERTGDSPARKPFDPRSNERARPSEASAKFGPDRPKGRPDARPGWRKDDRNPRSEGRPPARREWKREGGSPSSFRPAGARPASAKPVWNKPAGAGRPPLGRPAEPRRGVPDRSEGFAPRTPSRLRIDAVEPKEPGTGAAPSKPNRPPFDRARSSRPAFERPSQGRNRFDRPASDRTGSVRPRFDNPRSDRPKSDRGGPDRPGFDRPRPDRPGAGRGNQDRSGTGRSGSSRPFRGEGGLARPFTTSSGKPRAGGARPSTKPGKPGGRSYGAGPGSRPGSSGPRTGSTSGWKPKAGGAGKSGYKAKPAGGKGTESHAGNRPGGARYGKKPK